MPDSQNPGEGDVELHLLPYEHRSPTMASARHFSQHEDEPSMADLGNAEREREREREEEEMTKAADSTDGDLDDADTSLLQRDDAQKFLAEQADQGQNFTVRGILVGTVIGVIICFSNMYFGLQTGWISGMTMPAALIGFGFFKTVARCIDYPFTPVENVLIQTVAGAVGTMPLGCGFVGVIPALNYLLKSEENGPMSLSTGKLIVWSLGICFFGVVFAVPLRKEVIIRERLKFPSGTATALLIGVLHGNSDREGKKDPDSGLEIFRRRSRDMIRESSTDDISPPGDNHDPVRSTQEEDHRDDWKAKIKLLILAFGISAVYVGYEPTLLA